MPRHHASTGALVEMVLIPFTAAVLLVTKAKGAILWVRTFFLPSALKQIPFYFLKVLLYLRIYFSSLEHCQAQTIPSNKGLFRWNSTSHGRVHLIECPFGAVFHDRESSNTGFAKRRCYLLSNGSVAWGRPDTSGCREEVRFSSGRHLSKIS